jgi:hypothetical protein
MAEGVAGFEVGLRRVVRLAQAHEAGRIRLGPPLLEELEVGTARLGGACVVTDPELFEGFVPRHRRR